MTAPDPQHALARKAAALREEHDIPALGFAISRGGKVETCARGVRRAGDDAALTANDVFHFGSCGKAVTSALIHGFVAEGRFSLDTPLSGILPFAATLPAARDITPFRLLTHTSGLPANYADSDILYRRAENEPLPVIRRDIVHEVLEGYAGATGSFSYSNLGYTLLGAIVDHVGGASYEDLVKSRIFGPLGMQSAGFGAPPERWGHYRDNDGPWQPYAGDNPIATSPAGTMHASMVDWMKFLGFLMRQDWVAGAARREVAAPDIGAYTTAALVPRGGWLWHNGANGANYAANAIMPEKGLAIIAVTNAYGDGARKAVDVLLDDVAQVALSMEITPAARPRPSSPAG